VALTVDVTYAVDTEVALTVEIDVETDVTVCVETEVEVALAVEVALTVEMDVTVCVEIDVEAKVALTDDIEVDTDVTVAVETDVTVDRLQNWLVKILVKKEANGWGSREVTSRSWNKQRKGPCRVCDDRRWKGNGLPKMLEWALHHSESLKQREA
jgi:hypothetical protein